MRNSSAPAPTIKPGAAAPPAEPPDLELPVAPGFVSRPPRLDPQVMLRRCASAMPWRNSRPGERERRLAEKILEEFVL
ncbi:MAG: hypothetical protein ACLQVX_05665 [Limisphaerales bacterium]